MVLLVVIAFIFVALKPYRRHINLLGPNNKVQQFFPSTAGIYSAWNGAGGNHCRRWRGLLIVLIVSIGL
jgi:hypothetical protein